MKTLFLVLAGVIFPSLTAMAQDGYRRVEFFGGYSYLHTDEFDRDSLPKGWAAGVTGNLHRNFGVEANFSGHYQNIGPGFADRSYHLFLFGPRAAARFDKLTPWAHALVGDSLIRAHAASNSSLGPVDRRESATRFAWAMGGGLDVQANRTIAIRILQADYIRNSSVDFQISGSGGTFIQINKADSNNLRLSFGIVFRAGGQ